ncbi:MAG TPA: cupin domain-containing protein [Terriglobales bacterium]|jgi:mannose-6-phosphate isomerase-like protein (cupin superfamily)|nr:cupin domain-containing protein [Terriglobales bacterium]
MRAGDEFMHISVPQIGGLLALLTATAMAFAQNSGSEQSSGSANTSAGKDGVKYYSKDDVAASFAKGGTLTTESNYKVMTAHRTESGNVEVHRSYTDVFYIVQGSTNIVTGGKVIGEKASSPDEPRGDSIEGGETRRLSAGDAIVIPAGVPHWMKDVQGTLLYFVVKVKNP